MRKGVMRTTSGRKSCPFYSLHARAVAPLSIPVFRCTSRKGRSLLFVGSNAFRRFRDCPWSGVSRRFEDTLHEADREKEEADHDSRPPGIECSLEDDEHLNGAIYKHAKERAYDAARPAGQQRAADDNRRNGVQLHPLSVQRIAGEREESENDSGQRRAETAHRINRYFRSRHRKPHENCGLLATADCIDGPSELRIAGNEQSCKDGNERDNCAGRKKVFPDNCQAGASDGLVELVAKGDRIDTDHVTQPTEQVQTGQGNDEGRYLEGLDEIAHEESEPCPHQEDDRYYNGGTHVRLFNKARRHHS